MTDPRAGKASCSDLAALAACPGKLAACRDLPDLPAEEWTDSGTRVHAGLHGQPDIELSEDETEMVQTCAAIEAKITTDWIHDHGEPVFDVREERFWGFDGRLSGQPDVVNVGADSALVMDYKTGRKEVDSADVNLQMRGLAVLVWQAYPAIQTVRVAIIQPWVAGQFTVAEYGILELLQAEDHIQAILDASDAPNAKRVPGPQCRYCRAQMGCPEFAAASEAVATLDPVTALQGADLARVLELLPVIERRCGYIKQHAKALLEADPDCVPGWRLKEGANKRSITDPQSAFRLLADVLSPGEFAGACSVAIGKLETAYRKATGLKAKEAKQAFEKALGEQITVKQTAPQLERVKE